ncbi:MAG: hypothetical protein CFE40_13140 [Burkholderiales bacterium PBB1]|nr:MAG: hypothetical protein CFE40_13140 [Burkholderiales bacterium PBB1]
MTKYISAYLATAVVMIVLDLLWLGVIATPLYQQGLGHLMAERPNLMAAAAFYVLYVFGLLMFTIVPQAADASWLKTAATAAMFGFVAYATYDLSNLATLRDWPVWLSLIDMTWGAVLSAVAAIAGRFAWDRFA